MAERKATAGPPTYSIRGSNASPRQNYVIAAVDPDAPTPQNPSLSQIRHFLGGNFQTAERTKQLLNTTAAVSEFLQPTPPAGSDAHR